MIIHFSGSVDLSTFVLGREALQLEPGWSRDYAHIFDFTDVVDTRLSKEAINALAEASPIFDRRAPQVLVTRPGTFDVVIARTFQALAKGRRVAHLASSVAEARALIGKSNSDRHR